MDWYKHYMGDYLKDTADLSMTQDGAYRRLLDRYYTSGQPLPIEKQKLYLITRAIERWEREAVDSVLAKFFILTSAGYTQKRTEKELAKYKKAATVHIANLGRKMDSQNGLEKLEARNQIKEKSKNKSSAKTALFVLPDWIPVEEWNGFVEMRQRSRAPFTVRAKYLCVKKLDDLRRGGVSPAAILNQSVENGWKGLFPLSSSGRLLVREESVRREVRVGASPEVPDHPMCESPSCRMCAARRREQGRDTCGLPTMREVDPKLQRLVQGVAERKGL